MDTTKLTMTEDLIRSREILALTNNNDKLIMYLSSRPDNSFNGWEQFTLFKLHNLTQSQVMHLVDKIPYDEDTKTLFRKKMETEQLFETHKAFLVNPLLVIMMLVTLEQFPEIPAKIHLFYEYAFEALFAKHDTSKSGFQRKRYVKLALDDYRRLFSYFCAITYLKESFSFGESTALETLEKCIAASQILTNKEDMLNDLVNCTCMLSRDGLEYVFSHRSFQEYFMAYFVSRVKTEEFDRIAARLAARGQTDSVLTMISEMNKEKFEESWVLPQLERIWSVIKDIDPSKEIFDYILTLQETPSLELGMHLGRRKGGKLDGGVVLNFRNLERKLNSEVNLLDARATIWKTYNLSEKFLYLLRESDGEDEIITKIHTSVILKTDKRFDQVRKYAGPGPEFVFFLARRSDNKWLLKSSFAEFWKRDKIIMSQLLDEVRGRVEARKTGIQSILEIMDVR